MSANLADSYPALATAAEQWPLAPAADALAGKTLLVTGAGDGIGAVAAKAFACHGANVVLLGRTRSKLEAVFDWIGTTTATRPVIVPADLAGLTVEAADTLAQAIEEEYGALHGVLHNASLLGPKVDIEHYPATEWQRIFQVNVHAPMILTQALLPLLKEAGAATLVFTSSSVGRQGRGYWGAYAASKFALEGLMQILADELENTSGVRAVSLNPGATRTAMRAAAYPGEDPDTVPMPEAHMDAYIQLFALPEHVPQGAALSLKDASARAWFPAL